MNLESSTSCNSVMQGLCVCSLLFCRAYLHISSVLYQAAIFYFMFVFIFYLFVVY
jgi:hypothetical protein